MKHLICMQIRSKLMLAVLASLLLAGCASTVTAPVRDVGGAAVVAGPSAQPGMHVVRPGDTLLGIARQYGVTLPDLVSWNDLTDPNQIQVGQSLRVGPADAMGSAAVGVIAPGEGAVALPIPAPSGAGSVQAPFKQSPLGGRKPYSDEAWSRDTPDVAPAVTPPTVAPEAPAAAASSGEWQWPAAGRLLSGYNEASNKGVDIGGNVGDPVLAAAAGKVVYAGSGLRGYGKLVVIKHNQEYNSVYAHNDKLLVKEDDQVVQGQKIAELGSSESDRSKLHFEIRKQGKAVDPMKYLPAR